LRKGSFSTPSINHTGEAKFEFGEGKFLILKKKIPLNMLGENKTLCLDKENL